MRDRLTKWPGRRPKPRKAAVVALFDSPAVRGASPAVRDWLAGLLVRGERAGGLAGNRPRERTLS